MKSEKSEKKNSNNFPNKNLKMRERKITQREREGAIITDVNKSILYWLSIGQININFHKDSEPLIPFQEKFSRLS